jgi:CRISPR/Cas system-associated exonuclease Cas4 (RecB family)
MTGNGKLPYLSHSRVAKYLHCPEQYRLHYVEGLRPRRPDAGLVFGQVIHGALSALFRNGEDPIEVFLRAWQEVESVDIDYGRDSWVKLKETGLTLLTLFVQRELPKFKNVRASEKSFTLAVSSLGLSFVGVVDLVAELAGKTTVVDFKTAASAYPEYEAAMNDQLTAYQLAEPEAEQSALCVFVKTKEPRIDWQVTERRPGQILEYLDKVDHVAREIGAGRYYKRPGRWCSYCDFLPVCLGDERKIQETLVTVSPNP